jgi:hypothetical protein
MSNPMQDSSAAARAQCSQFDLELPAFLEGEDRPLVVSHANQCPYCSVVLADLQLIQTQLPESLLEDPPARVWANVRATLESEGVFREPSAGWRSWIPQGGLIHYAAPFAALASLVLFSTVLLLRPTSLVPPISVTSNNSSTAQLPTANTETLVAPEGLVMMEKAYHANESSLDPVVLASYQKGLKSLDNTIEECKASVKEDPGNNLAREYLATAYEQKAAVLSAALEYNGQ